MTRTLRPAMPANVADQVDTIAWMGELDNASGQYVGWPDAMALMREVWDRGLR